MNRFYFLLSLFVLASFDVLASTIVSSSVINTETFWSLKGSPYIIQKNLDINAKLVIEPGVEIRIGKNLNININNQLIAGGTQDNKILFTANNSNPNKGFWGKVTINDSKYQSLLNYCIFEYGGNEYSAPLVINSKIFPQLTNLKVYNNKYNGVLISDNVFKYGGRLFYSSVPYLVNRDVSINKGAVINIDPGVVIKFFGSVLIYINGDIVANGSFEKPIIFTSINDDLVDNVDSDAFGPTSGNPGDWGGLIIENSVDPYKTIFRNCIFSFAGGSIANRNCVIQNNGAEYKVEFSRFEGNYSALFSLQKDKNPDFGGGALKSDGNNTFIANRNSTLFQLLNKTDLFLENNCWDIVDSAKIIEKINNFKSANVFIMPYRNDCSPFVPEPTLLEYPPNDERGLDINIQLSWFRNIRAENYTVQIAKNNSFAPILYEYNKLFDTTYKLPKLEYNTRYYWRVKANNWVGDGEWAESFSFKTHDTANPYVPQIVSPKSIELTICDAYLTWSIVDNAEKYAIQIAEDQSFKKLVFEDTLKSNKILLPQLDNRKKYYWHVKAYNVHGWSNWSVFDWFITRKSFEFKEIPLDGLSATNIKTIDYNSDAKPDLIFLGKKANQIKLYVAENKGNKQFEIKQLYDQSISDYSICDVNNDNIIDIAIYYKISSNNYIDVYSYKNFKFSLIKSKLIDTLFQIDNFTIRDINNDGLNDIIMIGKLNNKSMIQLRSSTKYEFAKNLLFSYELQGKMSIDDIDNDGLFDVLVYAPGSNILNIIHNKTDNFSLETLKLNYNLSGFVINDVNMDYYPEIISFDAKALSIYYNNKGKFEFLTNINLPFDVKNLDIFDTDLNGIDNILLSQVNSNGSFTEIFDYDMLLGKANQDTVLYDLCAKGDFDANYKIDLIVKDAKSDKLFIYSNLSCKNVQAPTLPEFKRFSFSGSDVVLEWDKDINNVNKTKEIRYNVRIRNSKSQDLLISPMADYASGIQRTPFIWNAGRSNFMILKNIPQGEYKWAIQAVDNAGIASGFSKEETFYTNKEIKNPPSSWINPKPLGDNTLIHLLATDKPLNSKFGMRSGDGVAVFFMKDSNLVCGGYGIWNFGLTMSMTAWGDSPLTPNSKDGFDNKEKFVFRVWDHIQDLEIPVAVKYVAGSKCYETDSITYISGFELLNTKKIPVSKDKCNWISSSVSPYFSLLSSFVPKSNQIIINSKNESYEPNSNNSLISWKDDEAYQYYSKLDDTLQIEGTKLNPSDYKFLMKKNQWNWLPFIHDSILKVIEVFKNNKSSIKFIKDDEGNLYSFDKQIDMISVLQSSRAYKVFTDSTIEIVLPNYNQNIINQKKDEFKPFHLISNAFGTGLYSNLIYIDNTLADGDEIAALNKNNQTVASGKIVDGKTCFAIWIKNPLLPNSIGANLGDSLTLVLYKKDKGTINSIALKKLTELTSNSLITNIKLDNDKIYFINAADGDITSVNEEFYQSELKASPNPFNDRIIVETEFVNQILEIAIFDLSGKELVHINTNINSNKIEIDTKDLGIGDYTLKIIGSKFSTTKRIMKIK